MLPNPTVDLISVGAKLAKKFKADVILGIGGGSSLDTAKAIASIAVRHTSASQGARFVSKASPIPAAMTEAAVAICRNVMRVDRAWGR